MKKRKEKHVPEVAAESPPAPPPQPASEAPAPPSAAAAEAPPPAPAAPPAPSPEETIAALRDQMLRLRADFENYRKRVAKERDEWRQLAYEDLMRDLIDVLDHFELGLRSAVEHGADRAVVDGFRLTYEQMLATLNKYGLTPVDTEGQPFDPYQHEAIGHQPSDAHPADIVLHQMRRGYRLGDKLLRPAQVVVSSGPGPAVPSPSEPGEGEMDWGGE